MYFVDLPDIDLPYDFRYKLFYQKQCSGNRRPPTEDALMFNIKRANYQCYRWKNANIGRNG